MPDLQVDMAWPLALTVSIPVGLALALFGIGKKNRPIRRRIAFG